MALKKDKGIIIQSSNIGESHKLISILSEIEPRRNYLIRGIRKSKTRPIASSEIGSLVELNFYEREGKDWCDVKEISLIERFDTIKKSVIGFYFLSYISEIANRLIPEGEKHNQEAKLVRLAFQEVEKNGFHFGILPFLKIRLLAELGIIPIELACSDCGEEVYTKDSAEVLSNLEIHCGVCRNLERNQIEYIRFLSDSNRLKFSQLFNKIIPINIILESDRLLNQFLDSYLQKSLKTESEFYRLLKNELPI